MRIGLIGLGGMGRGLAKNMAAKGIDLTVADLDRSRVEHAVSQGAKAGGSVAEIAALVDVLAICITTAEAVRDITLGPDGALAAMAPGSVLLDHTTRVARTRGHHARGLRGGGRGIRRGADDPHPRPCRPKRGEHPVRR